MFDEITEKLKKYPGAKCKIGEDFVRVLPGTSDGFEVLIEQIWENHFTVSFDGWHEEFFDYEKALACFFMGLSNRCRLKIQEKGGSPFQWTLEHLDGADWRPMSSTQHLIHQFWKTPVVTYLQNDLIHDSAQDRSIVEEESLTHA